MTLTLVVNQPLREKLITHLMVWKNHQIYSDYAKQTEYLINNTYGCQVKYLGCVRTNQSIDHIVFKISLSQLDKTTNRMFDKSNVDFQTLAEHLAINEVNYDSINWTKLQTYSQFYSQ